MAKFAGSGQGSLTGRWLNTPQSQDLRDACTTRWAGVKSGQGVKKLASRLKEVLRKQA